MLRFQRNNEYIEVKKKRNVYSIEFPCTESHECSSIESTFPPGYYKIELYGASGGHLPGFISTYIDAKTETCNDENTTKYKGNTKCVNVSSMAGAGGYTSAHLLLHKPIKVFLAIGGKGEYKSGQCNTPYEDSVRPKGGFNGGGKGSYTQYGSSGGGGATDIRFFEDDYWHRVLVSGGGGGTDSENNQNPPHYDNGRGGSGGGLIAQGPWIDNVYQSNYVATQETGFTFGNGEAAQEKGSKSPQGIRKYTSNEKSGAGGGWFGGFSTHHNNGGSGGGSSFAFTSDAFVPKGDINSTDEYYENVISKPYAISHDSSFSITNPIFVPGIWDGDGFVRITVFRINRICTKQLQFRAFGTLPSLIFLIYS